MSDAGDRSTPLGAGPTEQSEGSGEDGARAGAPVVENPLTIEQARGWVGHKLDDVNGATAGRVEGVFVDSISGEPIWLVIRIGRLGRRSAVPFGTAAGGAGHVWVPYPRETIRGAPEVDPAAGAGPALERELCAHYGVPAGTGRLRELQAREEEQVSCRPV